MLQPHSRAAHAGASARRAPLRVMRCVVPALGAMHAPPGRRRGAFAAPRSRAGRRPRAPNTPSQSRLRPSGASDAAGPRRRTKEDITPYLAIVARRERRGADLLRRPSG
jgi:hypothetical protein